MEAKLQKWGNSMGIRIPAKLLTQLDIKEDDKLEIDEYNGSIIIRKSQHMTIEERLEGYEALDCYNEEIKGNIGNELL